MVQSSFIHNVQSKYLQKDDEKYTLVAGKKLSEYSRDQQNAIRHDYLEVVRRGGEFSNNCRNPNLKDAKKLLQNLIEVNNGYEGKMAKDARIGHIKHKASFNAAL